MLYQAPRGTEDATPRDVAGWRHVEETFRAVSARYGYGEIRTPTFEDTELFTRTSGDTSEVVTKQMYTFTDKGGRSVTLKPEGTAPVLRAVLENRLLPQGGTLRLGYVIACYRYERPQKGRLRELHQVGLEFLGSPSPEADAEVIEVTTEFYRALGLPTVVAVNHLGGPAARAAFREIVLTAFAPYLADQDEEARARATKNPLRLIDSKDPVAREIVAGLPPILDSLEPESRAEFETVLALLTEAGIEHRIAPEIVRGLDYYTGTVFEIVSDDLGAQGALCGGGRYDGLMREIGGPDVPSVGVGMGIERALIALQAKGLRPEPARPDAIVVAVGDETRVEARRVARDLRRAGRVVLTDPDHKTLKNALKIADRERCRFAVILGEDEIGRGVGQVRDLDSGERRDVPLAEIAGAVA